jgi:hypothetical protein
MLSVLATLKVVDAGRTAKEGPDGTPTPAVLVATTLNT